MASPPGDGQDAPTPSRTRERPSRLIDIMVALLLLVADAVIVVADAMMFMMVGMGSTSASSSPTAHSRDVPVLTWFAIWSFPAVAATSAVVHAEGAGMADGNFSVKYVNGRQNGNAGTDLNNWYIADRILHNDAFCISIR